MVGLLVRADRHKPELSRASKSQAVNCVRLPRVNGCGLKTASGIPWQAALRSCPKSVLRAESANQTWCAQRTSICN